MRLVVRSRHARSSGSYKNVRSFGYSIASCDEADKTDPVSSESNELQNSLSHLCYILDFH
jgi:hypothetical protein